MNYISEQVANMDHAYKAIDSDQHKIRIKTHTEWFKIHVIHGMIEMVKKVKKILILFYTLLQV